MAQSAGATIDDVLSTTLQKWASTELADNIFDSNALFMALRDSAKPCDGGVYIEEPVMYAKSSAVDSYSGYDTVNVSAQQVAALAEFNWKQYAVSVVIDGFSEQRNSGTSKIVDLLETRAMQAKRSLYDRFNTDLYGDGTGNGSKNLDGLAIQVDSTGTLGGLARATYSWWAAQEAALSTLTIAGMNTMFNNCSAGGRKGEHPNLLIGTQGVYEFYENLLQPDQRFSDNKMGDGGFLNLLFKGQPFVWDENATTQTLFYLNTNYLRFRYHPSRNFYSRPFVSPANQDAKVSLILWMGALTGNNPRRQGKNTGVAA